MSCKPAMASEPARDTFVRMDRMYRLQRRFYDLTRARYLLGRDLAIERLDPRPGEQILEVGCGTARNLLRAAGMEPRARYFGIDASAEMLATAEANIQRSRCGVKLDLRRELAEQLNYRNTFGLSKPFDGMLFSYCLSMIPTWREALEAGFANLRPGGRIVIVDFWDQGRWPWAFRYALRSWLRLFGVHFRPELMAWITSLELRARADPCVESVRGRYAYVAMLTSSRLRPPSMR